MYVVHLFYTCGLKPHVFFAFVHPCAAKVVGDLYHNSYTIATYGCTCLFMVSHKYSNISTSITHTYKSTYQVIYCQVSFANVSNRGTSNSVLVGSLIQGVMSLSLGTLVPK